MVRATLRCGSIISPPLLVIVVKPLNAKIEKATEASKASKFVSETGCENEPPLMPLDQIAAIANNAIPPSSVMDPAVLPVRS